MASQLCLQGDEAQAGEAFTDMPAGPEVPELQAVCVAAWLWAHARQETLDQVLTPGASSTSLPWSTSTVLALALETLLAWRTPATALAPSMSWLTALLVHQPEPTLEALRLLCRPGYLPAPQHAVLMGALMRLCAHPAHAALADQVAMLLGGPVLVERIETLLAEFDQLLAAPPSMPPQVARHRKQRQRRGLTPADSIAAETAHVLQLIHAFAQHPPGHGAPGNGE